MLGAVTNVVLSPAAVAPEQPSPLEMTIMVPAGLKRSLATTLAPTTAATSTRSASSTSIVSSPTSTTASSTTSTTRATTAFSIGTTRTTTTQPVPTTSHPSYLSRKSSSSAKRRKRSTSTSQQEKASGSATRSAVFCTQNITQPDPLLVATGLEQPNNATNECCCQREGLCLWREPITDSVYMSTCFKPQYEVDPKVSMWDDVLCDGVHPDDMVEYRERYSCWQQLQKSRKNSVVRSR